MNKTALSFTVVYKPSL